MGNRKQLTDKEKELLICYKYYSGDGSELDTLNADELAERRNSVFLRKPCGKGIEGYLMRVLDRLPISDHENSKSSAPIITMDFQQELSCETITIAGFDRSNEGQAPTFCFPAGQLFNLALDAAGAKLGVKQPLPTLDEPGIREMIAECRKGDERGADAVAGIVRLVWAFTLPGGRMTQALMDDWLDALPFKPASSMDGDRYLRLYGRHLQDEAKRKAVMRPRRTPGLYEPDSDFMETSIEKNPKQIRCLMDVLYFSIRAFAFKNGKPNMHRCPTCGRVFFKSHGAMYCSFTSTLPRYPKWTCRRATETTISNYSSEIEDIKKRIEGGLRRNRRGEEIAALRKEYKAFDDSLGSRSGFAGRVDRYKTLMQWLSVKHLDATGEPYVSREARRIRDAIAKRLSDPDNAGQRDNDACESFLSRFDGMINDLTQKDDLSERPIWCDKQVEWLSIEHVRLFGEKYVPKEAR